ncbi:MAG: hypothetical protein O2819_03095 [Planctomycetota bacterium]|nr:hypothetical protein [Planctomycetota bacterium]MDA1105725.1 hypothetical protein [Planctomycetota bacterium]
MNADPAMASVGSRSAVIRRWVVLVVVLLATLELVRVVLVRLPSEPLFPAELKRLLLSLSPIPEVPLDPTNRLADSPAAAALGEAIFFDPRFSANGQVSCATCHDPDQGFTDGEPLARGLGLGTRNSPTIIDAAHQRWFTWDGRADSMWAQALHPFLSPVEMGLTMQDVIDRIQQDHQLAQAFGAATGSPIGEQSLAQAYANVGKCLAAYERTVRSEHSSFDDFVDAVRAGDRERADRYPAPARRGLEIFLGKAGCVRCHHGAVLSDGEFHLVGVPDSTGQLPQDVGRLQAIEVVQSDQFNAAGPHSDAPDGEQAHLTMALIKQPELWGAVRTPSLRSAWATAPYMHAGQLATLEEVVHFYNTLEGAVTLDHHAERMLAPLGLAPEEEADLVAFLRSLQPRTPAHDG